MKKKIYNVFLVAFLMLSIVACGKSKVDIEVVVGQAEDLIESRLDGSGYIATSRYDEEENIFIVTMSLDVGDLSTSSENDEIVSDGTLWEAQTALYFRGFCRPYCAVL